MELFKDVLGAMTAVLLLVCALVFSVDAITQHNKQTACDAYGKAFDLETKYIKHGRCYKFDKGEWDWFIL